ncbi:MAG: hypothetical protein MR308_01285 [Lachnospiraceae bacterium]|nr:hypothetical protein [Lachnospiraceae bacterium]
MDECIITAFAFGMMAALLFYIMPSGRDRTAAEGNYVAGSNPPQAENPAKQDSSLFHRKVIALADENRQWPLSLILCMSKERKHEEKNNKVFGFVFVVFHGAFADSKFAGGNSGN